jgi:hypothetical protein
MRYARPVLVATFDLAALFAQAAGDFGSLGGIAS